MASWISCCLSRKPSLVISAIFSRLSLSLCPRSLFNTRNVQTLNIKTAEGGWNFHGLIFNILTCRCSDKWHHCCTHRWCRSNLWRNERHWNEVWNNTTLHGGEQRAFPVHTADSVIDTGGRNEGGSEACVGAVEVPVGTSGSSCKYMRSNTFIITGTPSKSSKDTHLESRQSASKHFS